MDPNPLKCLIAAQKFKFRLQQLADYAATIERFLATEFSSRYAAETLADIRQRVISPEMEPAEASDQLLALRETFPDILRGTIFVYVVATFEVQVRCYVSDGLGLGGIGRGASLAVIGPILDKEFSPGLSKFDLECFTHYKDLRDACAHANGVASNDLHRLERVAKAARAIPGASHRPSANPEMTGLTEEQKAMGGIDFDRTFVPEAIKFFRAQFDRISADKR